MSDYRASLCFVKLKSRRENDIIRDPSPTSYISILTHLFHCVFMALITHVKGMLRTRRFTTTERTTDGRRERERERRRASETDLNSRGIIFQDCFHSPDKAFTCMPLYEEGPHHTHTHTKVVTHVVGERHRP